MHFDYTFHFWTVLSQLVALLGGGKFLWAVYQKISEFVDACKSIVHEHHEMYSWYQRVKDQLL